MNGSSEPDGNSQAPVEERLRRLEAQLEALTDAVDELARGLSDGPAAEEPLVHAAQAGRRAHELLLLIRSASQDRR